MAGDKNTEAGARTSHPPDGDLPIDNKHLCQVVIQLNVARRNVGMYPPGHAQVEQSVGGAHAILDEILSIWPQITLGAAKDTILSGDQHLDHRNPVHRDFAVALNVREIAAVTFLRGLKPKDVEGFVRILSKDPEEIRANGGIDSAVAGAQISHITIQKLDYSGFHFTEEDEIVRSEGPEERSDTTNIWQDFVSQLVSGASNGSPQGLLLKDSVQMDPSQLADLINESKLDPKTALHSYERIIAEQVRTTERGQFTAEQVSNLSKLISLVDNLKPNLRKQFLAAASRHFTSEKLPVGAEQLLDGFPDDMIIEMIRQANEEGRQIPQRLMEILQRVSFTDDEPQPNVTRNGVGPSKEAPLGKVAQDNIQTLSGEEREQSSGDAEYDATLMALARNAAGQEERPQTRFPIDQYLKTLEDSHVNLQIGQALLAFMEQDLVDASYEEHLDKLLTLLPDFLEYGEFSFLLEVLEALRSHSGETTQEDGSVQRKAPAKRRKRKGEGIRGIASRALETLYDSDFLSKAVSAFENWEDTKGKAASDFLLALGPGSVPKLLDLYGDNEFPDKEGMLFKLLVKFGRAAVSEAQERLDDSRDYYVRNLLAVIQHAGTAEVLPYVSPLVQHKDGGIRVEALSILLKFKDPNATMLLREALLSRDKNTSSQALALAGHYGGEDVARDLVSMLKKWPLSRSGYDRNEKIISALGEIGNAQAIPMLEELARSSWLLYREHLAHMKRVLFQCLERYPRESIQGLLLVGRKSTDKDIRSACRRIEHGGGS